MATVSERHAPPNHANTQLKLFRLKKKKKKKIFQELVISFHEEVRLLHFYIFLKTLVFSVALQS